MIVKTTAALLLLAFTVHADYCPNSNSTHGQQPPPPGCGCKDSSGGVQVTVNLPKDGGSTGMDGDWNRRLRDLEDQVKALIARGSSG